MSKKLVAYFSASGQTKKAAEEISNLLNCDIYEIRPKEKYTAKDLNWNKKDSRTSIECKNREARPELSDKDAIISDYDTILIGFPIWWFVAPNIILTFLESYDFTGKKIIIWGTSWSSGMGKTIDEIKTIAKGANVIEGIIFDKNHRRTDDYKKLIAKI